MKNKTGLIITPIIVILILGGFYFGYKSLILSSDSSSRTTTTASVQFVSSTISAEGSVTAQNQANLNFQVGGKLAYLPVKNGDKVYAGETIAKLDTYALQRNLATALSNYRTARDTFEQAQENGGDNIVKTQLTPTYSMVNGIDSTQAVNEAIARIGDENQNALDNSVANVELANYALQLSSLTSPIGGVITREDVTVAGLNVTPITTFTVEDPTSMVFRANVPTEDIYYISEGSNVSIAVDGIPNNIDGTVIKIYPSKVTLPTGETVYQVDIQSDQLKKLAKLDETGTALISTNSQDVALVPAWTVLGGKYIWMEVDGTPKLKEVTAGKIHGDKIEILGGLDSTDQIIIDPKFISQHKYQML